MWWLVEEEEVAEGEGDWCRHTEGTDTVAGTVDTVDTVAFAGSTLCKTWRGNKANSSKNEISHELMDKWTSSYC